MVRRYVDVICLNDKRGMLKPLYLIWNDTRKIPIVKVKEICFSNSLKRGGTGLRYTCLFEADRIRHLYYDEGKWYVEQTEHMV